MSKATVNAISVNGTQYQYQTCNLQTVEFAALRKVPLAQVGNELQALTASGGNIGADGLYVLADFVLAGVIAYAKLNGKPIPHLTTPQLLNAMLGMDGDGLSNLLSVAGTDVPKPVEQEKKRKRGKVVSSTIPAT